MKRKRKVSRVRVRTPAAKGAAVHGPSGRTVAVVKKKKKRGGLY